MLFDDFALLRLGGRSERDGIVFLHDDLR